MIGRVIEDDLLGIARRLKSIDDGYFVFLNYKTGNFEVHDRNSAPNTLQLVLPYDRLDERTVTRVRMTRAERAKELFEQAERENARLERERVKAATAAIARG